ncbi:hypothetical protein [Sandaracinus amylolyticus]|uniref:hypothetical protein n=1 Tax=Sandaracinus amylolyticus TaxID=927083 RepID=UPI001F428722|nr:hypothetical protein [Sandaracinus amylolyticus]UJR83071.1 Hypothetical protein I5071_51370 [Sandaracinus amylolyticus]
MSFDIAVWEGPRPRDDDDAASTFASLANRYLEREPEHDEPTPARVRALIDAVRARFPDDAPEDRVWALSPIDCDQRGPLLYPHVRWDYAEVVLRVVSQLAAEHGLVCFDPQDERLV